MEEETIVEETILEPTIEYDVNYEPDELPELSEEQEEYMLNIREKGFHPEVESFMRTLVEDYGLKVGKAETIAKEECDKKGMSMWRKDYVQQTRVTGKRPKYVKLRPGQKPPRQIKEWVDAYEYKLIPKKELEQFKKDHKKEKWY